MKSARSSNREINDYKNSRAALLTVTSPVLYKPDISQYTYYLGEPQQMIPSSLEELLLIEIFIFGQRIFEML